MVSASASVSVDSTVLDVVTDLRREVAKIGFPLPIVGAEEAEASRRRLEQQLDTHLLPRLREAASPALVVVAGSTGAGKSTLVNSLIGSDISPAGVLRPTTRQPVLACNPADEPLLPGGRIKQISRVVFDEAVPRGLALCDAPDLDSLVAENRSLAEELLEAADLWLFVTTPRRYGDALPWQALARAAARGASVAMVLARVSQQDLIEVRADLLVRLREHQMTDVPLFVVLDVGPHTGLLAPDVVAPIKRWLGMLGGPTASHSVVRRTLQGSLRALPGWVEHLCAQLDAQASAADLASAYLEGARPEAQAVARAGIDAGAVAGTSVAARWHELNQKAGLDRVKIRHDVVRSSSRAGRRREAALAPLRGEVLDAARRALIAVSGRTGEGLAEMLAYVGAPGIASPRIADPAEQLAANAGLNLIPPGVAQLLAAGLRDDAARVQGAGAAIKAWDGCAGKALHLLEEGSGPAVGSDARRVAAAVKAYGRSGLATLLLAAAIGNDDARLLLARLLGDVPNGAVAALRDDLAARALGQVDAEFAAALAPLAGPHLEHDAAIGLRVRLAELRRQA